MPKLRVFANLTLVFVNGELKVIHRKGRAYKVHEVQPLQDMKFNLGKSNLMLIDLQQLIYEKSYNVTIELDGNKMTVRNVTF